MTEEIPVASRGLFAEDTEYDTVRLDIRLEEKINPRIIETFYRGAKTSELHWWPLNVRALFPLMDRGVETGDIAVEYWTPNGIFREPDVPDYIRPYVDLRNPFRRQVSTPRTLVEERREHVTEWARENTTPRIMALAMVSPKISNTADALTSRKRHIGQIWWAYVTHILAAAQHDPWLEHTDIWPAIERALEIDAYEFMHSASPNEWNSVAGYMEAYSRIYRAHARYLTSAPAHVRLVDETPPVFQQLPLGAAEARHIVYGGDT